MVSVTREVWSMPRGGRECSIADALSVVGERWSLLAMREILLGVRRFDLIVHATGASRDILTSRLRKLVERGVLERVQYEQSPPRYEYVPTEAGRALGPILLSLMEWGDRYVRQGSAPTAFACECGSELHPVTVCGECGAPVSAEARVTRLGAVR
ncbi:winged helix-turn-helix transcriptional regulator [Streptomyces sp. NPDC048254]|uniref:winged helix-turn-helix transcriptional regulator n=1 Tax=Streptomyces sp. NPDC048254 TaxID=3365525 RepID=UPI0037198152